MLREESLTRSQETPIQQFGAIAKELKVNAKSVEVVKSKVSTESCALNHFPGFPHFVRNIKPFVPCQAYVRSLFSAGHGYPMYDPQTVSKVPKDYHVCGISIGDVGVLAEDGEFRFAFNIFLPADHPYNEGNTPDSFSPLEPLDESEIHTVVDYFPRGSVVTSKGIKVTRHSESPLNISFHSSERLGGLLILPEGATRQDVSTDSIHQYVARNAHEWAFFFAQSRWYPSQNGSTYVVTGVDKASGSSTMSFQVRLNTPAKVFASFEDDALFALDGLSAAFNAIKPKVTTPPSRSFCVFLRGIRIGVGRAEWIENVEERTQNAEFATPYTELYFPAPWVAVIKSKLRLGAYKRDSLPAFKYFAHPFHLSDIIVPMMLSLVGQSILLMLFGIESSSAA